MYILTHWLPGRFAKNAFFGHFGDFQSSSHIRSNLPKKVFATWQHTFLSTSKVLYDFLLWHVQKPKWPMSLGFSVFTIFSTFPFPLFLIFLLQLLTFYWACFQFKNIWDGIIKTGVNELIIIIINTVEFEMQLNGTLGKKLTWR